jgi:hypothetical protein
MLMITTTSRIRTRYSNHNGSMCARVEPLARECYATPVKNGLVHLAMSTIARLPSNLLIPTNDIPGLLLMVSRTHPDAVNVGFQLEILLSVLKSTNDLICSTCALCGCGVVPYTPITTQLLELGKACLLSSVKIACDSRT